MPVTGAVTVTVTATVTVTGVRGRNRIRVGDRVSFGLGVFAAAGFWR